MINLKDIWYNIKYGIKNLFTYFVIIWKDRDFDSYYIFILLRKKLEIMAKMFERRDRYEGVEKDVKRMKFCIKCLDRLIEDDYFSSELEKKWGEYKFIADDSDNILFSREKIKTKEDQIQYDKEFREFVERASNYKERDLKLLFRVLEKYIEYWWD
jgi:hypothetical protein